MVASEAVNEAVKQESYVLPDNLSLLSPSEQEHEVKLLISIIPEH